ncbi:hypothetical protein IQ265_06395 [Nodosilinea sp. LEGE 06152]|uniref:hypothetical protein n=1 Tax=Nodosilinea sp. LEGE 06152 TaxID=2777966 RepID=UPI00187E1010|nr:hypothetical protein [Nodosilinea sp. LEGE 06152]MBE9156459.1 hypothetical protein [Nodosilinea sp. LEGE 06152]
MKPFIRLAIALAAIAACLTLATPVRAQPSIQLQTFPPLSQVVPNTEPVRIDLTAVGANQQPLTNAQMVVTLMTPPKTPFWSSDFPIVEGTTLLELADVVTDGQLAFQTFLPIRGSYSLRVEVAPLQAEDFKPFEQILTLQVPENPIKYRNAAILMGILLLAGFGCGWILGAQQVVHPGEVTSRPVQTMLSVAIIIAIAVLLVVNISAEITEVHQVKGHSNTLTAIAQQNAEVQVEMLGETAAVVGRPSTQRVHVKGNSNITLKISAVGLEHNQPIFAYETAPKTAGEFTWKQQFFDGGPHRVTVDVAPARDTSLRFEPFSVGQEIHVEGISPPLLVRLIGLVYYTSLFVAALAAGYFIHRRNRLLVRC